MQNRGLKHHSLIVYVFVVYLPVRVACSIVLIMILYVIETYNRLELERKKTRTVKQAYRGPMIRYHSVSMPLIEELPEQRLNVEDDGLVYNSESRFDGLVHVTKGCSKLFTHRLVLIFGNISSESQLQEIINLYQNKSYCVLILATFTQTSC